MVLPESLTAENIIGTALAGVVIAVVMVRRYMKEWNAPTSPAGDRVIPGVTIADMEPIRQLEKAQGRTADAVSRLAAANERTAEALEKMLIINRERAEDAEIVRRAEIMAQEMIKQLQPTRARRRP